MEMNRTNDTIVWEGHLRVGPLLVEVGVTLDGARVLTVDSAQAIRDCLRNGTLKEPQLERLKRFTTGRTPICTKH